MADNCRIQPEMWESTVFRLVTLLFVSILSATASAGARGADAGPVRHSFEHSKTHYVFEGGFVAGASLDCLINIFYDYNHFNAIMSHVEDIHLDRQGDGWYEVTYTYRNPFYKAVSTFRRTLDLKNGRVSDELIRVRQSGVVVPHIDSIRGYYSMRPTAEGIQVTFYQEGRIEATLLGGFYFGYAERQAATFMERVKAYAEKVCPQAPAIGKSPAR